MSETVPQTQITPEIPDFRALSPEEARPFAEILDPYERIAAQSRSHLTEEKVAELNDHDKLVHEYVDATNAALGDAAIRSLLSSNEGRKKPYTRLNARSHLRNYENRTEARNMIAEHKLERHTREIDARKVFSKEQANPKEVLDKDELDGFVSLLQKRDRPDSQLQMLRRIIQRDSLKLDANEVLRQTRIYLKEKIKSNENGPLLHYHQTRLSNLKSIIDTGKLISHDARKKRGEELKTSGAQSDVVQMTRDRYDASGKLVGPGLAETSNYLVANGEVAFVFDESVMDQDGYDSFAKYPSLPEVPLSSLRAVVVTKEVNVPQVKEAFAKKGMVVNVVLRQDWLKGYN